MIFFKISCVRVCWLAKKKLRGKKIGLPRSLINQKFGFLIAGEAGLSRERSEPFTPKAFPASEPFTPKAFPASETSLSRRRPFPRAKRAFHAEGLSRERSEPFPPKAFPASEASLSRRIRSGFGLSRRYAATRPFTSQARRQDIFRAADSACAAIHARYGHSVHRGSFCTVPRHRHSCATCAPL